MRTALFPGSFDPLTRGHMDVVQRALALFDEVCVGVLHNPQKRPLFTVDERVAMLQSVFADEPRIRVAAFSGLLVHFAQEEGIAVLIRGIRDVADVSPELQMAHMNAQLAPQVQTVFVPTCPEYMFVSSSLVKDVAEHGGEYRPFVPDVVADALARKYHP